MRVFANPYYEDKEAYNLDNGHMPLFGFPLVDFKQSQKSLSSIESKELKCDMILPTAIAMKREKIIMDHVLKCFTWGRKVRRDTPLETNQQSKADEI